MLLGLVALPPILLAAFVIFIDPYYVFGSPSWRGINAVRPYYEPRVLIAKPYQVWRQKPSGVALGSSRAEVGIDPRHGGWADRNVFNFALPGGDSYAVMLAFLHAQRAAAPLRQAVVGLDFFAFNIYFGRAPTFDERRFARAASRDFAEFLRATLPGRERRQQPAASAAAPPAETSNLDEALYLAVNPDVAAAIARKEFKSAREHYELAGRAERRPGAAVPADWSEDIYLRVHPDVAAEIKRGTFISGYHHYLAAGRAEGRLGGFPPENWNEALYLAINPDVAAAIARREFKSGREHYELAGRAERRHGASVPPAWDEAGYLQAHPDVAAAIARRDFISGYHHYFAAGRAEGRIGGFVPEDWNEADYLAANPEALIQVAMGQYRTGYLHYAAVGRQEGLLGGFPAVGAIATLRHRWPALDRARFLIADMIGLIFSADALRDAVNTIRRQSEPAEFDSAGMRVWSGHEENIRRMGGSGIPLERRLATGRWQPMLTPPKFMYCFTNDDTGATMFDPFRFMVRRAYAEGTDLRLFVTPLQAAVRTLIDALGLNDRYDYWLRELARINEDEAIRAGRAPFPLWDFSAPNTITREPVPPPGTPSVMRWFWEFSHYRKETGDLILDRLFDHAESGRTVPADFGTALTTGTVDSHLARTRAALADWAAANPEFAGRIVHAARTLKAYNRQDQAACW